MGLACFNFLDKLIIKKLKKHLLLFALFFVVNIAVAQNVGIVRKNYFTTVYDTSLMTSIEVLDSSTIRLGTINPVSGVVSNIGNKEYTSSINLTGATINPYSNRYYIGKGTNFLTFDINSGEIIADVPVSGSLPSSYFQNFRFNNSDSTIYGMLPVNFYSTYYDSIAMMEIEVLDSTQIRFASLNPETGKYKVIGNTSFSNLYTLAGNSIDPYQMLYYYSAVDTLIGIDLYTGSAYSTVPIQLPPNGIFENITYSCRDTAIYGITRQNHIRSIFDSLYMDSIQVLDSTTFRLSKINPTTGVVTFISPKNIGTGGNLNGGAFIDPFTMMFYYSNGNQLVGVSMITGLISTRVVKTFSSNAFAFDMMRSNQNCYGAAKMRLNWPSGMPKIKSVMKEIRLYPNPAQTEITLDFNSPFSKIEILDYRCKLILETKDKTINISSLSDGLYFAKITDENEKVFTCKFVKN